VEQIGNLAVENGRLINENAQLNSRYQVLEQEYQCSTNTHKIDIDNVRMTIESMEAENHNLRASLIERDKKTAELIRYLQRCSFLCTAYSATSSTSSDILNEDDNNDDDDNDDDNDVKKEYTTPQTINDTSIEMAKHLTSEIHEKLALFLEVHENNVDTKMNALHDKLEQQQSLNDDLSRQLDLLTKEKKQLITDLDGANNLLLSSVHDEIKWDRERDELFAAIIGLKQENEKLHESLSSMSKKKQVERVKVESLSKELELKSSTIHAVQSVLGSMKEEQTKIKETIEYLREENTKLRGHKSSSTLSLDVSSDSSTRLQKISSSSLDATDTSSQTSSLVKENKNLRKAYATLSSKLFDEMEKTDSLRIANEGLGTRICKLVALIQKQNNTLDLLDRETIRGDDAMTSATGKSNKSSRRQSMTAPGKHYP
jgi:chromosome segregation ATPase